MNLIVAPRYGQYACTDFGDKINNIISVKGAHEMITYDRLWKTMNDKGITQYRLINYYKFSRGQLSRLKHNENVNIMTLDRLCQILNCNIEDIVECGITETDNKSEK